MSMNNETAYVMSAIRSARRSLRWRAGKADEHLAKRIRLGHPLRGSGLVEYEALIHRVLSEPSAEVYLFTFRENVYPTVVATVANAVWLVMLDISGGMETAFLVEQPQDYFADPRFERLGLLQELEQ